MQHRLATDGTHLVGHIVEQRELGALELERLLLEGVDKRLHQTGLHVVLHDLVDEQVFCLGISVVIRKVTDQHIYQRHHDNGRNKHAWMHIVDILHDNDWHHSRQQAQQSPEGTQHDAIAAEEGAQGDNECGNTTHREQDEQRRMLHDLVAIADAEDEQQGYPCCTESIEHGAPAVLLELSPVILLSDISVFTRRFLFGSGETLVVYLVLVDLA